MKKNLPLSPHLQIYKPQITSVLSIAHRITGFSLNLALVLTTIWIVSISLGDIYYQNFVQLFQTLFIKFVVYLIVLAISYHALNGIRHILWDLGYLIDSSPMRGAANKSCQTNQVKPRKEVRLRSNNDGI